MIEDLVKKYEETFGENFPTFIVNDEKEMEKIIKECLEKKMPFTDYDKKIIY